MQKCYPQFILDSCKSVTAKMPKRNFSQSFQQNKTGDDNVSDDSDDSANETRLIHKKLRLFHQQVTLFDWDGPSTSMGHSFYEMRDPQTNLSDESLLSSNVSTLSSYSEDEHEFPTSEELERLYPSCSFETFQGNSSSGSEIVKQVQDADNSNYPSCSLQEGDASSTQRQNLTPDQTVARETRGKRKRKHNTKQDMELEESLINDFEKIHLVRTTTVEENLNLLHDLTDEEVASQAENDNDELDERPSKKCKMSESCDDPNKSDDVDEH